MCSNSAGAAAFSPTESVGELWSRKDTIMVKGRQNSSWAPATRSTAQYRNIYSSHFGAKRKHLSQHTHTFGITRFFSPSPSYKKHLRQHPCITMNDINCVTYTPQVKGNISPSIFCNKLTENPLAGELQDNKHRTKNKRTHMRVEESSREHQ